MSEEKKLVAALRGDTESLDALDRRELEYAAANRIESLEGRVRELEAALEKLMRYPVMGSIGGLDSHVRTDWMRREDWDRIDQLLRAALDQEGP